MAGTAAVFAGCGGDDYGDCDPDGVDLSDEFHEEPSGWYAGSVLCDEDFGRAGKCMDCGERCFNKNIASKWNEVISRPAIDEIYTTQYGDVITSPGFPSGEARGVVYECGPMWLEKQCCFLVEPTGLAWD